MDPRQSYWCPDPWLHPDVAQLSFLFPILGRPPECPSGGALEPKVLQFLIGCFFLAYPYVLCPPANSCRCFRSCEVLFFQTWRNRDPGYSVLHSKATSPLDQLSGRLPPGIGAWMNNPSLSCPGFGSLHQVDPQSVQNYSEPLHQERSS